MSRGENGSILLYIVVVMIVSLLLAGGLYIMSSTSLITQPSVILGEKALYLAEAGYRYAAGKYLSGQNMTDKIDILEGMDNSTYFFDDGSSYTLHIYPFFFRLPESYNNATNIKLKAPGTIPPQIHFPDKGYLKIGEDVYHYTNGKKTGLTNATVTLDSPITAFKDTIVYFAFYPKYTQDVQDGGTLVLEGDPSQLTVFPERNGYIEIQGETYFYHFRKPGSIKLTELQKEHSPSFTIHVTSSTPVLLKTSAYIESVGRVGTSSFLSSSRKISYYVPITDEYHSAGGGTQVLALSNEPGGQDIFQNLQNWDKSINNPEGHVTTEANIGSNHGWSKRWATFYNLPLKVDFNPTLMNSYTDKNLHAIWGNSWDNVYVVGDGGTILHFNGSSWTKMNTPTSVILRDIYGFGEKGSEKMVAVGNNGEILLCDMGGDGQWKRNLMTDGSNTYTENDLFAVWGTSWDHITTYGNYGSSPFKWYRGSGDWPRMDCKGCTGQYSWYSFPKGTLWRPYDWPGWKNWHFRKSWEIYEGGYTSIFICGKTVGPNSKGLIFREKPDNLSYYRTYNTPKSFNSIWGSSLDDIYVVGNNGKIYHNNNGGRSWAWSEQNSGTNKKLNGVWGQQCGDIVYVVGNDGTLLYKLPKDISSWQMADLSGITSKNLNEVWGDPDVGIYAVGNHGTIVFMGFVGNPYKEFILPFKSHKFNEIEKFWQEHSKLLTYTAQVKVGWGYQLQYGATGLNFRWHESDAYPGLYEGYGVSFMVYKKKQNCENDYIPNGIKPGFGTESELNDRLLLVLWRQKVVNGAIKRDWIAYKDLTNDEKLLGDSWAYSGRLEDLSTLVVRVEEKKINGQKLNDVKIFYGDASTAHDEPHNPDYMYNNTNRQAYNPTYSDVSITEIKWPLWDLNNWNPDVDFFTLVCNVPVSENPIPEEGKNYWILNPQIKEAKLLADGATIRLTGFTTPSGDKFYTNDAHTRPEVALHAYGDIRSLNSQTFVGFSEFALSLGSDLEGINKESSFGALY